MSQPIAIRDDLYNQLKNMKKENQSFSDVLDDLLNPKSNNLQEAVVTQEGRITKTLAGKTILYKVKT